MPALGRLPVRQVEVGEDGRAATQARRRELDAPPAGVDGLDAGGAPLGTHGQDDRRAVGRPAGVDDDIARADAGQVHLEGLASRRSGLVRGGDERVGFSLFDELGELDEFGELGLSKRPDRYAGSPPGPGRSGAVARTRP